MDPQLALTISTVCAWLWPVVAPGATEFFTKAGEGLGQEFIELIQSFRQQTIEKNPTLGEQLRLGTYTKKKELLLAFVKNSPALVEEVSVGDVVTALQRILNNPNYFTPEDVNTLMSFVGYNPSQFLFNIHRENTNAFVFKAQADGKLPKLITEIHSMKGEHLFQR